MTLELQVSMGGTDWPHAPGDTIERPNGFSEYLFLRFRTPMLVLTSRGREKCEAGTCLIYTPGHPQWYQGRGVGHRDDWCHVSGADVRPCLEQAQLPLDTLFTPHSTQFFPLLIEEVRAELQRQQAHWQQVVSLAVARMILLLGRALTDKEGPDGRREAARRGRLQGVREQVHERLADHWTVRKMAELAALGENRFAVLYRECFGVSPMEDLIQARLHRAEWLLTNRHASVALAAEQCGFQSVRHFSRLFHRRVGCRPSEYHQAPRL